MWNETLAFEHPGSSAPTADDVLDVEVLDDNGIMPDKSIGTAQVCMRVD